MKGHYFYTVFTIWLFVGVEQGFVVSAAVDVSAECDGVCGLICGLPLVNLIQSCPTGCDKVCTTVLGFLKPVLGPVYTLLAPLLKSLDNVLLLGK